MLKKYDHFLNVTHQFFDFFAVVLTGAVLFYFFAPPFIIHSILFAYLIPGSLILVFICKSLHLYDSFREKKLQSVLIKIFLCVAIWMFCLETFFWLAQASLSNQVVHCWIISVGCYFVVKQMMLMLLARWFRSKGYNSKRVLLLGDAKLILKVQNELHQHVKLGYNVVKIIEEYANDIPEMISPLSFDQVWIAYPLEQFVKVKKMLSLFQHSPKEIRLITDISDLGFINQTVSQIGLLPIINIRSTPMTESSSRLVKAIEDRMLAFLILLLVAPIMLIIAFLIKMDSRGPIFFKQRRHSINGTVFDIYKFRTMHVHTIDNNVVVQATKNDARITRVGNFLRKHSLDELPQFFNVLFGNMSIVGPRPHAVQHNAYFQDHVSGYMLRHMVKSGITGLAQIQGYRGETASMDKIKKRVELDLYYIQHWSLWLDLKIIFLTVFKGFINQNAY